VHGAHALAVQDVPAGHAPHETLSPQPSLAVPHVLPMHACAFGTQQALATHLSVPAQLSGHVVVPPQPSGAVPHASPAHASEGVQQAFE